MGYLRFFLHNRTFYRHVPYPMHKKIVKNPLNFFLLTVKKFHGGSVINESGRAKKLEGGSAERPPPSLFRVNINRVRNLKHYRYETQHFLILQSISLQM